MRRPLSLLPVLLAAASAFAGEIEPAARETSLMIGRGWAVVRELRTVSLQQGENEFNLEGVPAEADLSTLVVRSRRVPAGLVDWQWVADADAARVPDGVTVADGAATWRPGSARPGAGRGTGVVRCRMVSPAAIEKLGVDVVYVVRGPDWSAHYQVAVRGEQAGDTEPVSVDLAGFVTISNPCSISFSNAAIRLVGRHAPPDAVRRKEPGFPMVDLESPLAGLWVQEPSPPLPEFDYAVPARISIQAGESADVSLIQASRAPASRIYRLDADDYPAGAKDAPLRKWIVFRNVPTDRPGVPLPPGPARIFLGGMRTRLLREAWFAHTPAGGELRIDLGLADDVLGSRFSRGRTAVVAGYFEESFGLRVVNRRATDVRVELDEKPPVSLEWDVVSATRPYVESGRRLRFSALVGAGREDVTEYRLRIRQPGL